MTTRMLIDARHREETRVAVIKGNRIEEFDFESAEHKQIKGNIYLAKVTRVEPSLQAAFVDYGGNRHGFLAFAEIHPDYYQIPREDREALLREEAEHAAEEAALLAEYDDDSLDGDADFDRDYGADFAGPGDDEYGDEGHDRADDAHADDDAADHSGDDNIDGQDGDDQGSSSGNGAQASGRGRGGRQDPSRANELRRKRMALRRRYKIQDVIKRRQVLLVQVVKEERGNKGAALTTYLSLAGRYCVLMPNTSNGGGISRKISSGADRKRLKSIISDMQLPPSMGCIVRTAGLERTKTEIKRDFDYLARLWDEIREKTLSAVAPAEIHSDSDLVKRAIRDIYNRDIEDVLVEGEEGYRAAREFMKLLMPSHAKKVRHYADPVSLFQRYGAEDQLAAMYSPTVQLKSGGYLVINPTEALVSIDINSGRSTKEHGIEATAVKTNMEAAHEIARQLRLRDMAGLVVIDFIDMEHNGNIRKVERAMKDALKNDRARIQVGRISSFGLMEMSRQRLRTGVLEASTKVCPHCEGTGLVRTASSAALSLLRLLEETAASGKGSRLLLRASQEATIYALNNKRVQIAEIEERYGVTIAIMPDGETEGARMAVDVSGPPPAYVPRFDPVIDSSDDDIDGDGYDEDEIDADTEDAGEERGNRGGDRGGDRSVAGRERDDDGDGDGRSRRRRRRRGKRRPDGSEGSEPRAQSAETGDGADGDAGADEARDSDGGGQSDAPRRESAPREDGSAGPRTGRRRGGRNRNRRGGEGRDDARSANDADGAIAAEAQPDAEAQPESGADAPASKPRRAPRGKAADAVAQGSGAQGAGTQSDAEFPKAPTKRPTRRVGRSAAASEAIAALPVVEDVAPQADDAPKPARRGRKVVADADESVAQPAKAPAKTPAKAKAKAAPKAVAKAGSKSAAKSPAKTVAKTAESPDSVARTASSNDGADDRGAADDGNGAPRRGGWWQRTFGTTAE